MEILIWFVVIFFLLMWALAGIGWIAEYGSRGKVTYKHLVLAGPGIWVLLTIAFPFWLITAALYRLE